MRTNSTLRLYFYFSSSKLNYRKTKIYFCYHFLLIRKFITCGDVNGIVYVSGYKESMGFCNTSLLSSRGNCLLVILHKGGFSIWFFNLIFNVQFYEVEEEVSLVSTLCSSGTERLKGKRNFTMVC